MPKRSRSAFFRFRKQQPMRRASCGMAVMTDITADLKNMLHEYQERGWSAFDISAVLNHGRPYIAAKRSKEYRARKPKRCFSNAAKLAFRGLGTYVEGFAAFRGNVPLHHAWITLDGLHAIDVTWVWHDPDDCHYFGIEFPGEILARYCMSHDCWVPLLSDRPSPALFEMLAGNTVSKRSTKQ
jgi:hypothetical protein